MEEVERILVSRKPKALSASLLVSGSVLGIAIMMVSTAFGAPVPKATGCATLDWWAGETFDIEFCVFDYDAVYDDRYDRGVFEFIFPEDGVYPAGTYYMLNVVKIAIMPDTNRAVLAGQVVEGNMFPIDTWIVWVLEDGGEPGFGVDRCYGYTRASMDVALNDILFQPGAQPIEWYEALEGNIQVQV